MTIWGSQVVPRITNKVLDTGQVHKVRRQVCGGLTGEVLEIGFGSGLNVQHYPPEVTRVSAVEPSDVGWSLAQDRLRAATVPVERAGLDGQALPFPDGSFDAALSTFTLCTIPHVDVALREVRRVLRPGGALHFAEHGRAPEESVRRWQSRIEPLYTPMAGGCHLARPIDELISAAGFTVERLEQRYLPKEPRLVGYLYSGVARA